MRRGIKGVLAGPIRRQNAGEILKVIQFPAGACIDWILLSAGGTAQQQKARGQGEG
jgi:hypothetical protein